MTSADHDSAIRRYIPGWFLRQPGSSDAYLYISSQCVEVSQSYLKSVIEEIKGKEVTLRNVRPEQASLMYDTLVRDMDRLHMRMLKVSSGCCILCVCWHGPHNEITDDQNKSVLHGLLSLALHITARERSGKTLNCEGFVIAGDFNLKYSYAQEVIKRMPNVTGISTSDDAKDYMLTYPNDLFTGTARAVYYKEFNHPVVYLRLRIGRNLHFYNDDTENSRRNNQSAGASTGGTELSEDFNSMQLTEPTGATGEEQPENNNA